ncbi:MAG: hypothetical protein QOD39_1460, partial [Mycobacterium sp.]|nr:hypothetical protein [Mycobacterium sp.]
MSMEIGVDVIGGEEYDRQQRLYGPLAEAVRRLNVASIHTEVDEQDVRDAQAAIEAAAEMLERKLRAATSGVRVAETGRPLVWSNPAVGLRNAIAPPMVIQHDDDGRCWSEFILGPAYEGPPGWVHGGICALLLDHLLGEVASEGLTLPKFTGTITLRYLRGTPLGPLRAEAFVERSEGVKTFARGYLI